MIIVTRIEAVRTKAGFAITTRRSNGATFRTSARSADGALDFILETALRNATKTALPIEYRIDSVLAA